MNNDNIKSCGGKRYIIYNVRCILLSSNNCSRETKNVIVCDTWNYSFTETASIQRSLYLVTCWLAFSSDNYNKRSLLKPKSFHYQALCKSKTIGPYFWIRSIWEEQNFNQLFLSCFTLKNCVLSFLTRMIIRASKSVKCTHGRANCFKLLKGCVAS